MTTNTAVSMTRQVDPEFQHNIMHDHALSHAHGHAHGHSRPEGRGSYHDREHGPHRHPPGGHVSRIGEGGDEFWFVTMISNPVRYRTRVRLYREFRRHILEDLGANLLTVELQLGETHPHVTGDECDPEPHDHGLDARDQVAVRHVSPREVQVQVSSSSMLWSKENCLNIGLTKLPRAARYVAWVDADVTFLNPHVVRDTMHALQVHKVVQMFEHCIDLGPRHETMQVHTSFGFCHHNGHPLPAHHRPQQHQDGKGKGGKGRGAGGHGHHGGYAYDDPPAPPRPSPSPAPVPSSTSWHPGYVWAAKLETLQQLGGLFDVAVLGAGDHHMACCMAGRGAHSAPTTLHPNYHAAIAAYEALCERFVQRRIGFVPGTILHAFHGRKADRQYVSRWDVLVRHQYDPVRDLRRNLHGVYEYARVNDYALQADIVRYFESRNEDVNEA